VSVAFCGQLYCNEVSGRTGMWCLCFAFGHVMFLVRLMFNVLILLLQQKTLDCVFAFTMWGIQDTQPIRCICDLLGVHCVTVICFV